MSDQHGIGSTRPGRYGAAMKAQLSLQRMPARTVWNLQGGAEDPAFVQQVRGIWRVDGLPRPQRVVTSASHQLLWVGPRSWLVFSHALPGATPSATQFSQTRDQLNQAGGALFDVSAARVGWTLRGPRALELLSSGCPLDLHHTAFPPDSCAQSLFGHVAALYHRQADGDFTCYVARSFSDDVWESLCAAAAQYTYEVLPDRV